MIANTYPGSSLQGFNELKKKNVLKRTTAKQIETQTQKVFITSTQLVT